MNGNRTKETVREPMTKEEAEDFLGILFLGKHHIPGEVKKFGNCGWRVNAHTSGFSTFDYDMLTRLVFLAHDKCVRVGLVAGSPGHIGIAIWKRYGRSGDFADRHPTIKTALANWRMKYPAPTDGAQEHGAEA